jgi:hypothetical protein
MMEGMREERMRDEGMLDEGKNGNDQPITE